MKLRTLLTWSSCAAVASTQDLATFLNSRNDLSSFRDALDRVPSLRDALYNTTNITILAPTNAAFEPLAMNRTIDIRARLDGDEDGLSELLQYHVLNGTWSNDTLYQQRGPVHTLLVGRGLVTGGQVVLPFRNVNRIAFLSGNPSFQGQQYSRVLDTDITDTVAGVTIHTIDNFLHIPLRVSEFARQWSENSLRELNSTTGNTRWMLLPALETAGLLEEVESTPDVTLFTGHLNLTERVPGDDLDAVLRYHVVTGRVLPYQEMWNSTELAGMNYNLTTLEGSDLYVNRRPHSWQEGFDAVWVNDNEVGGGDFIIENGVMNVLDQRTNTILTPPGVSLESAAIARCIPSNALAAFLALLVFALS